MIALFLFACAQQGNVPQAAVTRVGRVHEVRCGDLTRFEFYYTEPYEHRPIADAVSPWKSNELVWLGSPMGLDGSDLASLRVIETPQSVFGPHDPLSSSSVRPLVPAIEFRFLPAGGKRFQEIERTLEAEHDHDLLHSRGMAILLGGHLFLHPSSVGPWANSEPEVMRTIELKQESFDEIVDALQQGLGCG